MRTVTYIFHSWFFLKKLSHFFLKVNLLWNSSYYFALDILSADRQVAKEIEFDLRKFEEEQEEMKRLHDQQNTVQSLQVATSHCNHKSLNGCHVKINYQMVVGP